MNNETTIKLDGSQIAQIQDFIDGELEAEISIKWFPESEPDKDGNDMPAGYYAWFHEYPEDGAIYLQPFIQREQGG
jgi:hypothetical protein